MSNLEDLYQSLELFQSKKWNVPQELLEEIDNAEKEVLDKELMPAVKNAVSPTIKKFQRPFRIIIGFAPGGEVQVEIERCEKTDEDTVEQAPIESFDDTVSEPTSSEPQIPSRQKIERQKSVGFSVTFPDGTVFQESKAINTFIKALQKIGLSRIASDSRSPEHAGYRVVDKRQRLESPYSQRLVNGYYIFKNISNEAKVEDLKLLSEMYDLHLIINQDVADVPETDSEQPADFLQGESVATRPVIDKEAANYDYPIKMQFQSYLSRKMSENTANNYVSTLNNAVRQHINDIVDPNADSVFSYTTPEDVELCIAMLKDSPAFRNDNETKHNTMTAALSNYLDFIKDVYL